MSGLVGMWNLDGRPVERPVLERLSDRLGHRGCDGAGQWVEGPVGLACRLFRVTPESRTEAQPAVGASGAVLVFDGRLDNREELLAALGRLSADAPDATLVLSAYAAFGDRFPERLLGDFALGLFDPSRKQLLLARDAMGVRPLYHGRAGATFLFASEIKALLAHPAMAARPNDDLLAGLAQRRLHLEPDGGATCFADVFSVPPGHLATLTPDGLRTRRYWDFDLTRRTTFSGFEEYAGAFRELLARAVGRRLRSARPVAVSVSGGLDSSSIFCFADRLAREGPGPARAVGISSVGPPGSASDERAFLEAIERHCGCALERLPIGPAALLDGARDEVWWAEVPLLDPQWRTTRGFLRASRARGARLALSGSWGDQVLFDQTYLLDLVARWDWARAWTHLREYGRWFTDTPGRDFRRRFAADLARHYLPGPILRAVRALRTPLSPTGRARRWYTSAFRRRRGQPDAAAGWNDATAGAHARALYREVRSKFHTLCLEWNNKVAAAQGLEIAFPFLDRDLVAFLISIPGQAQTWNGVPKAILREAGRGVLPEAIAARRWKADFSTLVNDGVMHDYAHVARCLGAHSLSVAWGYAEDSAVRRELARAERALGGSTCEVSWALADLLALELWLQAFFGHERAEGSV